MDAQEFYQRHPGKIFWNWSAALLGPLWSFYRKMYGLLQYYRLGHTIRKGQSFQMANSWRGAAYKWNLFYDLSVRLSMADSALNSICIPTDRILI